MLDDNTEEDENYKSEDDRKNDIEAKFAQAIAFKVS